MITVIIPTCDRPISFLNEAIASVLNQSLTACEIIIVDNGGLPVEEVNLNKQVKLFRLQPHVGPSRARNFGAAIAKGDYLAFLDDDDFWDPNFLDIAYSTLKSENTACVYGRIDIWDEGGQKKFKQLSNATLNIQTLVVRNPGTGGINLLIEKKLFWLVGGFQNDLMTSEDKALAIEILKLGEKISINSKAIAIARQHYESSLSSRILPRLRFIIRYRQEVPQLVFFKLVLRIFKLHLKSVFKLKT